ncbi:MAG: hypothetical protein HQL50_11850 [Magnetococcales bacterium]|nr:hypothetical protein [Magnetococcales bacterium]
MIENLIQVRWRDGFCDTHGSHGELVQTLVTFVEEIDFDAHATAPFFAEQMDYDGNDWGKAVYVIAVCCGIDLKKMGRRSSYIHAIALTGEDLDRCSLTKAETLFHTIYEQDVQKVAEKIGNKTIRLTPSSKSKKIVRALFLTSERFERFLKEKDGENGVNAKRSDTILEEITETVSEEALQEASQRISQEGSKREAVKESPVIHEEGEETENPAVSEMDTDGEESSSPPLKRSNLSLAAEIINHDRALHAHGESSNTREEQEPTLSSMLTHHFGRHAEELHRLQLTIEDIQHAMLRTSLDQSQEIKSRFQEEIARVRRESRRQAEKGEDRLERLRDEHRSEILAGREREHALQERLMKQEQQQNLQKKGIFALSVLIGICLTAIVFWGVVLEQRFRENTNRNSVIHKNINEDIRDTYKKIEAFQPYIDTLKREQARQDAAEAAIKARQKTQQKTRQTSDAQRNQQRWKQRWE